MKVPDPSAAKPANGKRRSGVKRPIAASNGTKPVAPVFKPSGTASSVNRLADDAAPVETIEPSAKPAPIPTRTEEKQRPSNPLVELPPFQIQPESEFSNVEDWDSTDYEDPQPGSLKILFFNVLFLVRAIAPVASVAGLLFAGFYYFGDISQTVNQWHTKIATTMRPEPVDTGLGEILDEMPQSKPLAKRALTENLSDQAASVAIQANVQLSVPGVSSGSGVICDVSGEEALILTKRSLIDQEFWISQGKITTSPAQLPNVELVYSDASQATGEVVWVAAGGVDLAIVRASAPVNGLKPVKRQATSAVSIGDVVFYVEAPGGFTERMARTTVLEVSEPGADSDEDVPLVQVDSTALAIGSGLYNKAGELVAISGGSDVLAGGETTAVHISALGDLDTPSLLSSTTATSLGN
ncbi:MAG: serine protease [Planctomycetaceae bacterium]